MTVKIDRHWLWQLGTTGVLCFPCTEIRGPYRQFDSCVDKNDADGLLSAQARSERTRPPFRPRGCLPANYFPESDFSDSPRSGVVASSVC